MSAGKGVRIDCGGFESEKLDAGTFTALLTLFGVAGIVASVVILLARSSMKHPDTA